MLKFSTIFTCPNSCSSRALLSIHPQPPELLPFCSLKLSAAAASAAASSSSAAASSAATASSASAAACSSITIHCHRRRLTSTLTVMSSASSSDCYHVELNDESDFDQIVSSDGLISICGFGSLLSEKSARSTFPELINFRMGKLSGFRRVFAHTAPVFFERGIARPQTKEISSLSVEPCDGDTLIVTLFEIQRPEIPSFIEREHEFRFLAVIPETLNGLVYVNRAVLCARYSEEEYFQNRCKGSREIFFERYGRYNIRKIWQDDILPCRVYLRHCVLAAKNLGDMAYNNFLDHTFLADRKTTIREYLATSGSGIMEEEPPAPLKDRYGG